MVYIKAYLKTFSLIFEKMDAFLGLDLGIIEFYEILGCMESEFVYF